MYVKMFQQVLIFVGQRRLRRNFRQLIPCPIIFWTGQIYHYYYQKSAEKNLDCLNTT